MNNDFPVAHLFAETVKDHSNAQQNLTKLTRSMQSGIGHRTNESESPFVFSQSM